MSFTGAGPLGTVGWGTPASQALQKQAEEVRKRYDEVQGVIKKKAESFPPLPFPELTSVRKPNSRVLNLTADSKPDPWPAAVFTANELQNWPEEKRTVLAQRKKEYMDQPADIVEATKAYREAQLASLQRRHAAIESQSADKRAVIHKVAAWLSSLVVNVRLREILCYTLIRDQIKGGQEFYDASLKSNDHLKEVLRALRVAIYNDPSTTEWYKKVDEAQNLWAQSWEKESKDWVPKLSEYLVKAPAQTLVDICASHENPGIAEPTPSTNHDLNYGQQLTQMYEILHLHHTRTGNMQGIPRPRWEADWACTDGLEPAYRPTYDNIDGFPGKPPKATGRGVPSLVEDPDPPMAKELPPAKDAALPNIGIGLPRIVTHPDATTPEIRKEFTAKNEKRKRDSIDSIQAARLTKFGTVEAEKAADDAHLIDVAKDRAKSLTEYLSREPHTSDLEGSYYWNEVQLAFRNHGTHWETLGEDITPLGHHYLLIHYDVQFFKATQDNYRLKVFGCIQNPVELTLAQVKEMGKDHTYSSPMVMECSGNGRAMMKPRYNQHVPWGLQAFGCYCWTGTPLRVLIDRVAPTDDCIDVVFTGYDAGLEKEKEVRYFSHSLNIHDPVIDHSWLIWMNNGVDLLPEHGYPLRLMVPAWYGNVNIKWLRSIEFMPRRFKGAYQRTYSYTKTPTDNDIAVPSQELRPRAMVAPIGLPDFTTRKRTAVAGQHTFRGKCWVGGGHYRAIIHVELSLDGGKTWMPCHLEPRIGIFAWANFSLTLDLPVGLYEVAVRATDNLGQRQKNAIGLELCEHAG